MLLSSMNQSERTKSLSKQLMYEHWNAKTALTVNCYIVRDFFLTVRTLFTVKLIKSPYNRAWIILQLTVTLHVVCLDY
jgi:hypothetical protein